VAKSRTRRPVDPAIAQLFQRMVVARRNRLFSLLSSEDREALQQTQAALKASKNQDAARVALDHLEGLEWDDRRQKAVAGVNAHPGLRAEVADAHLRWLDCEPFVVAPLGEDRVQARAAYAAIGKIVALRAKITSLEAWRQGVHPSWATRFSALANELKHTADGRAISALAAVRRRIEVLDWANQLHPTRETIPAEVLGRYTALVRAVIWVPDLVLVEAVFYGQDLVQLHEGMSALVARLRKTSS
jgi:hypothetical protein